jgi:hypothetical protein
MVSFYTKKNRLKNRGVSYNFLLQTTKKIIPEANNFGNKNKNMKQPVEPIV